MRAMGHDASDEQLKEMVDEVDDNHDGRIDFSEFLKLMKKRKPVRRCVGELALLRLRGGSRMCASASLASVPDAGACNACMLQTAWHLHRNRPIECSPSASHKHATYNATPPIHKTPSLHKSLGHLAVESWGQRKGGRGCCKRGAQGRGGGEEKGGQAQRGLEALQPRQCAWRRALRPFFLLLCLLCSSQ